MQETQETGVRSLGLEDSLEEGTATHSQCSCLENPIDRGAWGATERDMTEANQPAHMGNFCQGGKKLLTNYQGKNVARALLMLHRETGQLWEGRPPWPPPARPSPEDIPLPGRASQGLSTRPEASAR